MKTSKATDHAPVGTKIRIRRNLYLGDGDSLTRWTRLVIKTEPALYPGDERHPEPVQSWTVDARIDEGEYEGQLVTLLLAHEYDLDPEGVVYSGDERYPFRYGWQADEAARRLQEMGHVAWVDGSGVGHQDERGNVYHPKRIVVADRRKRDEDNVVPTLKALCDGLVDAKVVKDDTPQYMVKNMPVIEYRKGAKPHLELVVSVLPTNLD